MKSCFLLLQYDSLLLYFTSVDNFCVFLDQVTYFFYFYFNLLMKDRNNDCDVAYKEGKIILKRVVKTQALC